MTWRIFFSIWIFSNQKHFVPAWELKSRFIFKKSFLWLYYKLYIESYLKRNLKLNEIKWNDKSLQGFSVSRSGSMVVVSPCSRSSRRLKRISIMTEFHRKLTFPWVACRWEHLRVRREERVRKKFSFLLKNDKEKLVAKAL